jgi:short-subunit dehydrogenase
MSIIVISGGTRGIGRAIAEKFAQNGFDIVIAARNENDLKTLQKWIEEKYAVKCHIQKADLSIKAEVLALVDFIKKLNQKIDVLINNAGVYFGGEIYKEEEGIIEKLIETNLYSAYYLSRGLLEGMIENRSGHIFNMCSIASLKAYPNGGSYSISKFALLGFSKSLREEMKPFGVKVTSIMPGAVLTDSWAGVDLPTERFIKAEDIAETVWVSYMLSKSAVIEEIVIRPQEGDI